MIWDRELDSYGKVSMQTGDAGFCNYLYQGQTLDPETGLAYNRFRYYSPKEGMYISQDPIGLYSGQANFYAYIKDTNSWVDIFGLVGGGSYYQVNTNVGGEVHHMPANSINGLSHSSEPSIWMTKADHQQTGSHGSQGRLGKIYRQQQAVHFANRRFDKAMKMDIEDIKAKTKAGIIKNDYSQSMVEAVQRAKDKGLITEAQFKRLKKSCTA